MRLHSLFAMTMVQPFIRHQRAPKTRRPLGRFYQVSVGPVLALLLHLLQDLIEVVARRVLHRPELLVGFELLEPQRLTYRQDVPVVEVGSTRGRKRTAHAKQRFLIGADGGLEGIALD